MQNAAARFDQDHSVAENNALDAARQSWQTRHAGVRQRAQFLGLSRRKRSATGQFFLYPRGQALEIVTRETSTESLAVAVAKAVSTIAPLISSGVGSSIASVASIVVIFIVITVRASSTGAAIAIRPFVVVISTSTRTRDGAFRRPGAAHECQHRFGFHRSGFFAGRGRGCCSSARSNSGADSCTLPAAHNSSDDRTRGGATANFDYVALGMRSAFDPEDIGIQR